MAVVKAALFVLLVYSVAFQHADAWRRRRRRSCTPRACEVSQWSSWSSCSAYGCGQQGSQSRSRNVVSSPSCGGTACPDFHETRLCYASTPVDCQLSSWSEWSACTTPCGVSGTQSSSRHRIITERCGGTCTSTLRKTRACPKLSCLNGGTLQEKACFCKNGYAGDCCEKGTALDCQLSSWSQWSACSTPCGVSGTQSTSRHEIMTGEGGFKCLSATFRKTRACPGLRCLNGGSLQNETCLCQEDYSGVCCENSNTKGLTVTITIGISVGGGLGGIFILALCCYCCSKCFG